MLPRRLLKFKKCQVVQGLQGEDETNESPTGEEKDEEKVDEVRALKSLYGMSWDFDIPRACQFDIHRP